MRLSEVFSEIENALRMRGSSPEHVETNVDSVHNCYSIGLQKLDFHSGRADFIINKLLDLIGKIEKNQYSRAKIAAKIEEIIEQSENIEEW